MLVYSNDYINFIVNFTKELHCCSLIFVADVSLNMSLLRRTILLTLSLLMLMSSIGLSVGVHMCGGMLQNLALFHKADACPMEQVPTPPSCHSQPEAASPADKRADNGCCQDDLFVVDGVDHAVSVKADTSYKAPDFYALSVLQTAFLFILQQQEAPATAFVIYAPPPLVRDIPVLVQSFLI